MNDDFALFILSYGRADNVITIPSLKKAGYKGKIYFLVDDTDEQVNKYIDNFGEDNVFIFNKKEIAKTFDLMDNNKNDKCVVFARNKVFEIAKQLELKYFVVADDDYTQFNYRFDKNNNYITATIPIKDIEAIFKSMIEYMQNTNIYTLCFAQGGDFIGGKNGGMARAILTKRKAMNLYLFNTNRILEFTGRINEDVNMYVREGQIGKIVLTTSQLALEQGNTQANKGGLTDIYLDLGTYVKSFYSVMANPSAVSIITMGNKHRRLHHMVKWNNAVPKIIRQSLKIARL